MPDTLRDLKRNALRDQLDMLTKQFTAASRQLLTTLDPSSQPKLQLLIEDLERQIADVEAQLAALDSSRAVPPEASRPTPPAAPAIAPDRRMLRQVLAERFSLDELATLCYDLGVDFQNIPGVTLEGKAREIAQFFERRGRLAELAAAIRIQRPDAVV